ncbi:MAG: TonB-dependent receptor [Colwellia sp.]|nr:TonB-dependent receptor [Colwellia sp.]
MKQFSRNQLNLACINAIAVLAFSAPSALAAEEAKEATTDEIEVIQVTGLRGSLFEAVNRKRFSEVIADVIVAEDIGKMPDRNVAEALQRITGITINREDGEGTEVTIRGIAPNLNLTLINGQTMASAGDGRGIDFSSMPSSMISAIEVYKTPEASHMEGSIGGTVNIITARPLDVGVAKGTAFVEGVYTENNEESSPAFAFSYTTPITDTFGIAAAVSHEQINTRTDGIMNESWAQTSTGAHYPTRWAVETNGRDLERDSLMLNLQWQPTDALNLYLDTTYSKVSEEIDLTSFTSWLPSGTGDVVESSIVTDSSTNTVTEFIADSVYIQTGDVGVDSEVDTLTIQLGGELELDNLTISAGIGYSKAETDQEEQRIFNYDHWWWNADRHDAKFVMGKDNQWGYFNPNDAAYPEFYDPSIDNNFEGQTETGWDGARNLDRLVQGSVDRLPQQNTDKDISAHLDFEYTLDDNDYISSVEAGIRWNERSKTVVSDDVNLGPWQIAIEDEDGVTDQWLLMSGALYHDQTSERYEPVNFFGGHANTGIPTGWNAIPSFEQAEAAYVDWINELHGFTDDGEGTYLTDFDSIFDANGSTADRRGSADNTETTLAAYAQANLYLLDGDLTGNVGVRYVRTDLESFGLAGDALLARTGGELIELHYKHDYDNFLPSLNLSYKLNDDMVLRFAAATVIARPDFSQASAGGKSTVDGWLDEDYEGIQDEDSYVDGNVYLDPYEANQFDVSYEYYFSETGMFSAGFFYKDISSFIYEDVIIGKTVVDGQETEWVNRLPFRSAEDVSCDGCRDTPDGMPREYNLYFESYSKPVNGDGGFIRGLELGFLTTLEMIPGMENFGVQANYTHAASEADYASASNPDVDLPFENQSEHSYNLTGFYEGDDLMVRLAYNWRSESLSELAHIKDGYSVWNDDYGQLDASFSYNFTETISVIGSISNLLEESQKQFKSLMTEGNLIKGDNVPTNRNFYQGYNGRTFRLGIRATF